MRPVRTDSKRRSAASMKPEGLPLGFTISSYRGSSRDPQLSPSSCVLGSMTCLYLIGTYAEDDKVVAAEFWKLVNLSVAAYGKNGDMARREQKAPRIAEIGIDQ